MTTKLVDLKGTIARLDAALERVEAMRPELTTEAVVGLEALQGNTKQMRDELNEVMTTIPDGIAVDDARGPEEQRHLDESVASFTRLCEILESWLEEWEA